MCVHMYTHTYKQTHTHTHTRTHINTHLLTRRSISHIKTPVKNLCSIYIHTYTCTHTHTHTHKHTPSYTSQRQSYQDTRKESLFSRLPTPQIPQPRHKHATNTTHATHMPQISGSMKPLNLHLTPSILNTISPPVQDLSSSDFDFLHHTCNESETL